MLLTQLGRFVQLGTNPSGNLSLGVIICAFSSVMYNKFTAQSILTAFEDEEHG